MFCFFIVGCGPEIPTVKLPAELEKEFSNSFDRVWINSLDVIESLGGSVITHDKAAGLITCKLPIASKSKNETYTNIFIRRHPQDMSSTDVDVIPFICSTYTAMSFPAYKVRLEFQDVSFKRNYFSDVGNLFFEGLTQRLQGNKS